jgi:hypothetical protein
MISAFPVLAPARDCVAIRKFEGQWKTTTIFTSK